MSYEEEQRHLQRLWDEVLSREANGEADYFILTLNMKAIKMKWKKVLIDANQNYQQTKWRKGNNHSLVPNQHQIWSFPTVMEKIKSQSGIGTVTAYQEKEDNTIFFVKFQALYRKLGTSKA